MSPGRPEEPGPRVAGVPQRQATGTPGAQETAPCLRAASVSTLGSPPSELSPLPSVPVQWPGGEKGGGPETRGAVRLKRRLDPEGKNNPWT